MGPKDANAVFGELQVTISGFSNIPAVSTSQELLNAIQNAEAGDIIYVNQGTFVFNSTINLSKNGTANQLISLISHPNNTQKPKFDSGLEKVSPMGWGPDPISRDLI